MSTKTKIKDTPAARRHRVELFRAYQDTVTLALWQGALIVNPDRRDAACLTDLHAARDALWKAHDEARDD